MNKADSIQYSAADEVALKEVLAPLWSRRWKIVFFTLLVTFCVAFYVSLLKPTYQATAKLQIGSNKPRNTLSINDAFNEQSASKEQVQTQFELLRSRKFAERVIAHLDLTSHPEFRSGKYNNKIAFLAQWSEQKSKPSFNQVVGIFKRNLTISPVSGTELVQISYRAYSPELAKLVANSIGETYLKYQDELHSASKENTSQWLVEQLEQLGKNLESSEKTLQEFREAEGIVDVQGDFGLVGAELKQLTSSALKAKKGLDDLVVVHQYVQSNKNDVEKLQDLKQVTENPTFRQLRQTQETKERKLHELSQRYGPKHPKRQSVVAELTLLNNRIADTVKDIVASLEKDYQAAQQKIIATEERLKKGKQEYLRLSGLNNKFSQLQREVETNKELYSNYLVRLREADAMGNYKSNFYVSFLDKAQQPKSPVAPNKKLFVLMSFIFSFAMISIIVIMRELLMDTLNSRRKLDNFHEAPVLAVLPKFRMKKTSTEDDKYYSDNRFTEAIRTLRTAILFSAEKQRPPKVIAVTSSVPNEGKSTVALQLARSFSEMEKVLLVEADMRHPTLAKNLSLNVHRPGLSNLLAKTHQINECIVRDKNVKLDILTSGISPANPLAFLSMKRFGMLLNVFGNFYDRIVIETPPVNAVSDAVIISKNVDSVLYVVHGGKTKRDQITSGLRMLKQVDAPIEGVVINQSENIDTDKYHSKYYNHKANIIKLPVRKQG